MSKAVRQNVDRICQELVQKHLDLLLMLMAEEGMSPEIQRERMDLLVRSLMTVELAPTLFEDGRRVPMALDTLTQPPTIQANTELLERLEPDDILFAFTRPISTLLQLPPINVGLVLQGRDEKQLKNLYHGATRRLQTPALRATEIRAVIERRVTTFIERARGLAELLAPGSRPRFPSPSAFIGELGAARDGWPDWDKIAGQGFIRQAVESFTEAVEEITGLPPAETLLELCWESLDLSPQTFLRHAGRTLRTQNAPPNQRLIFAMAEIVAPGNSRAIGLLSAWPSMQELLDAWTALCEQEHETLARHSSHARPVPMISMLEPPGASTGLSDPEDLPWGHPLISWSLRETTALRDLLMGFVQGHKHLHKPPADALDASESEILLLDAEDLDPEPMRIDLPQRPVDFQVIGTSIEMPGHYEFMVARAHHAALLHLEQQVMDLPDAQQLNILMRLRGAYDGYFSQTKPTWDRRFQSWRQDPRPQALRKLAGELGHVLDAPAFFDPFETPEEAQLGIMPSFCFVVALSPQFERVPFRLPVSSIIRTAGMGAAPLRLRMIEVPDDITEPCRWLCDRELGMGDLQGTPVNLTLNALDRDSLRLIAFKA
jgi:hypothetical protein